MFEFGEKNQPKENSDHITPSKDQFVTTVENVKLCF